MKILVIEDETLLADSLKSLLTKNGFEVDVAYDGETGKAYAELGIYDLLILDVMLPRLDGYEIARSVRARRLGTPILMLTAKSELEDRITGLNAGADYYLPKPFDTRELLACINALLRRQGAQVNEIAYGNTALDLSSAMLNCGENRVRLSAKEFDIMRFLLQAEGRIVPKEAILAKAWGYDSDAVENHVEVYIGFLRKKLASIGSNIRIEAIRRLGYRLEVSDLDQKTAPQVHPD
ncbi:response regulator transcription factor [Thermoclostridium caenicola]|uniref:Stage 0 sporulation protein A homolog n=1 Tax=Thermoclostridium caenicola TaxID=659425 RepID=A0A1M6J0T6_9FIRM|nr:response regulator transcription factor [Thermoclostridium caenicola]SHJ40336.1 DNA-binding response regulator, OmpR family, contains REC and winged-helix (wHTH) domain [Thermoclostridium caenicola]